MDKYTEEELESIYSNIILPRRATYGSAGYDFKLPIDITLKPGETILVPTGIRILMDSANVLLIMPRSSLGFKYRLQLDNTVGVIDSDYFHSDNEGHIMIKITNDTYKENNVLSLKAGDGFAQGIIIPFCVTCNDSSTDKRNGGFGSTDK